MNNSFSHALFYNMNKQQKINNNYYICFHWNNLDSRCLTNIIFIYFLEHFSR